MSETAPHYDGGNGLAVIHDEMRSWKIMREQADVLVKSGFLGSVKTAEQALAIIVLGQELGFQRMQSFRLIDVIQGKPTLNSHGMATLVQRFCRQFGGYLRVVESTDKIATIEFKRAEWPEPHRLSFTIADAQRAGLQTDTWKKYPQNMLYARALANACRMGFPDVVGGIYDPDELGGPAEFEPMPIPTTGGLQRIAGPEITSTVEVIDQVTGEIMDVSADIWVGAIEAAQTQDELATIAMDIQKIPDASEVDKRLWRAAFNKRKTELAKANRAASEQLIETPADPDRFTQ